ncbi:hypothetical protein C9J48_21990 [Photobacterium profundum]|uniref:Uncharacterized protein n=1 Tax=Photobacterium profundum 3TCK TaxID=314280 RepID=Q1Z6N0_9GAMM|nr:hypothetical protein [Photobacterium profundum]EAS44117.1 hypothetical protein P3TCK_10558 [Photobacterium profundum 3TCK]PSV59876.1 hypothetical protein C9J48_21990 [Photobacterium profundum]
MKKAVVLLALLALVGCDEDDVKDILKGQTKVFAVSGVQVEGSTTGLPDGYYELSELNADTKALLPNDFPDGIKADLTNAGITVHAESCGQIVVGDEGLCFESGNKACVPDEIKKVGLDVYKIDLDDIKTAQNLDFYPTLAAELGGLFVQIDYDDVSCSTLN